MFQCLWAGFIYNSKTTSQIQVLLSEMRRQRLRSDRRKTYMSLYIVHVIIRNMYDRSGQISFKPKHKTINKCHLYVDFKNASVCMSASIMSSIVSKQRKRGKKD